MFKSSTPIALFGTLAALSLTPAADAGLVGHYKFDGDATDSAGSNDLTAYNKGTSAAPAINATGGADGGFASFDGGNLFNTTFVPVTGNADRTLSLWVRTTNDNSKSSGSNTAFVAGWGAPGTGTRVRFDLGLQGGTNDQLRNEYNAGATTSSTGTAINKGSWQHLAVTWSSGTNTATFYLNGAAYGTGTASGLNTGSAVGVTIGADTRAGGALTSTPIGIAGRFWVGDVDDVQIYDTALALTDIQTLFNNPGSAIPEPGSLALIGLGGLLVVRRRRSA